MKTKYLLLLLVLFIVGFSMTTISADENTKNELQPFVDNITNSMTSKQNEIYLIEFNEENNCYLLGFTSENGKYVTFNLHKGNIDEFLEKNLITHTENKTINNINGVYYEDMTYTNFIYNLDKDVFVKVYFDTNDKLDLKDYVNTYSK